jgi:uncharacterized membrane protein
MAATRIVMTDGQVSGLSKRYRVLRALEEFLAIPLLLILGFAALAVLLQYLDRATPGWLQPVRSYAQQWAFSTPESTGQFLDGVVGGMFTQVSIVITMLLVVLQQSATKMGNAIFDQFLNRHRNQVFAGYVTGTLTLALILRAVASETFNPVIGATALLGVVLFLMGLFVWFLYSIIEQMRPETVAHTIREGTHAAYERHVKFLARFRSKSQSKAPVQARIKASDAGFVAVLDADRLTQCLQSCSEDVEVVLSSVIGDYVSYLDDIAEIKGHDPIQAEEVARCVIGAYRLEPERNIKNDPTYGLEQLEMIAWTESSSAEHNPETGLIVLHILQDLLLRWFERDNEPSGSLRFDEGQQLPVVYASEGIVDHTMDIVESLATIASESMQHQTFTEIINVITAVYPHMGREQRARVDDTLRRIVSTMGIHVLTRDLDIALTTLTQRLETYGARRSAEWMTEAHTQMLASLGKVGSRFTRGLRIDGNGQELHSSVRKEGAVFRE